MELSLDDMIGCNSGMTYTYLYGHGPLEVSQPIEKLTSGRLSLSSFELE